jgi:hypothetical protein
MTTLQRVSRVLFAVLVSTGLALSAVACAKPAGQSNTGADTNQGQGQFGNGVASGGTGHSGATGAPPPATTKPPASPTPPAPTPPASISPVDCIPYDPTQVHTVDGGSQGVFLYEGASHSMMLLDNATDANTALGVARLYTRFCFIGRGNSRTDRKKYITEYFTTPSGLAGALPTPDCLPYDKPTLKVVNIGTLGWRLQDNSQYIQLADNATDAGNLLILAQQNSGICFIGRSNARTDRYDYIYTYWQP